jgi:integrase
VFKFGYDAGLIDRPVRFGPTFRRPSRKTLRKARAARGEKMLEAADIRSLLDKASLQLKAMILLGVNCGFGNTDVAGLPLGALDLAGAWVRYPRPKTGVDRRAPLWPETVKALREAIAKRPSPKNPDDAQFVFLTKYGATWFKGNDVLKEEKKVAANNPVTKEFNKLLEELKLKRAQLGFYVLRHVFATIADGARDPVAARFIMGHAGEDMASVYRERVDDDRLKAVVNHVRKWLFPGKKSK